MLDLKYFDRKLVEKSLSHQIFVSFMVGLVEASFRGETLPIDPPESVYGICNPQPIVGALESVGFGRVRLVRLGLGLGGHP